MNQSHHRALVLAASLAAMLARAAGAGDSDSDAQLRQRLEMLTPATDAAVRLASAARVEGPQEDGAVLVPGPPGSFDSFSVGSPEVHFDGRLYRMWYTGSARPAIYGGEESAIGLATSEDGVHWTRANGGQPVLTRGDAGAFDEARVEGCGILHDQGRWRMWYTGLMKPGTQPRAANWDGKIPAGWEPRLRIGLATSDDGIHWRRENDGRPVVDLGPIGSTGDLQAMYPTVLKEKEGYRMWYAANSIRIPHTVAMATSPDGVHWTKHGDGAPLEGLGWYVTGPAVCRLGDRYLMLCSPEDLELNVWIVRAALSLDGVTWQVLHDGKSVAPAGADLQLEGRRVAEEGSTHHPSAAIGEGPQRWVWYTENAGQGKGYRIAAGMLTFEQAAEDRRSAPRP